MHALRKLLQAIARWVRGPRRDASGWGPMGSAGFEDFFGQRGGSVDH